MTWRATYTIGFSTASTTCSPSHIFVLTKSTTSTSVFRGLRATIVVGLQFQSTTFPLVGKISRMSHPIKFRDEKNVHSKVQNNAEQNSGALVASAEVENFQFVFLERFLCSDIRYGKIVLPKALFPTVWKELLLYEVYICFRSKDNEGGAHGFNCNSMRKNHIAGWFFCLRNFSFFIAGDQSFIHQYRLWFCFALGENDRQQNSRK